MPLLSRYEVNISKSRYDLPHLRIPVIILIMPLFRKEMSSSRYFFRSICFMLIGICVTK